MQTSAEASGTKRPPTHYPARTCRCTDCGNIIYARNLCYRVNRRNVCEHCGKQYRSKLHLGTWTRAGASV